MDQLTLGLIGAGAVVVVGVMSYNAWQGAKVRRKIPRPIPPEAVQDAAMRNGGYGSDGDDDRPFIETTRERAEPGKAAGTAGFAETIRQEARREPSFGAAEPLDTAADLQAPDGGWGASGAAGTLGDAAGAGSAAASGVDTGRPGKGAAGAGSRSEAGGRLESGTAAKGGPGGIGHGVSQTAAQALPGEDDAPADGPSASAPSASLAPLVDRRIDCIVPIDLAGVVSAEKVLPFVQRLRRAGTKPVFIEGRAEDGLGWEAIQSGQRYDALRAAVQLANRSGALNELEFSEFVTGVQNLADTVDGAPEFPDMLDTVAMARELDGFAAQCDAQLSVNILSDGAPWSANYVQAVASQDGLLLSRDGTRFVKLDARQKPVFMMQFGDTNFLRDDLTYKGGHMITLLLDVPVADEDIMPFRLMCDYARSLSERIGAHVVDDQRRPLPDAALLAIEKQLLTLYGKLEMASMPAGSRTARRLFSN